MIKGPLLRYAIKKSYSVKNGRAFKLIDGYYVTLSEEYGYKRIVVSVVDKVDPIEKRAIEKFVDSNRIKYYISKFRWNDNNIEICFQTTNGTETVKKMDSFLTDFIFKLKASNVLGVSTCFHCHKNNDESSYVYCLDGFVLKAHGKCMIDYNDFNQITAKKEYGNGKIISGFFGALYGSIIGSILLFVSVMLNYPIFILGFLTGLVSRFYYDICDGYKSYFCKLISVLISTFLLITLSYYFGNLLLETAFKINTSYILAMASGFVGSFINLRTKGRDHYPTDRLYRIK